MSPDETLPSAGTSFADESPSAVATAPPAGTTPPAGGPPQAPSPEPASKNPWMWVAIALGVLLVIVAAYYFITTNKKVDVPNVVGMTQTAAVASLADVGLTLGKVTTAESTTTPEGRVISQDPGAARQVKTGSSVDLVISGGVTTVTVPDVVGRSSAEAESTLSQVGLVVVVQEEYSDTVAADIVIAQVPGSGSEAIPGDTAVIAVSKGTVPPKATVPDVVGKTQTDAEKALASAGFKVAVTEAYSDTVKKGVVGGQIPAAGTKVTPESGVEIYVSLGPGTAEVTVPNVTGKSEADAVSALQSAGLTAMGYEIYKETAPKGTVFGQTPPAGSETAAGTQVGIAVSLGKEPSSGMVTVPNVVGRSSDEASVTILAAGLTPMAVPGYSAETSGTVVAQSPVSGSSAPQQSTVIYLVSKGPNASPQP